MDRSRPEATDAALVGWNEPDPQGSAKHTKHTIQDREHGPPSLVNRPEAACERCAGRKARGGTGRQTATPGGEVTRAEVRRSWLVVRDSLLHPLSEDDAYSAAAVSGPKPELWYACTHTHCAPGKAEVVHARRRA